MMLAACHGRTTGASNFNSSNNTIKLNAVGSCDTSCIAYIRYRQVGAGTWSTTSSISVNKVSSAPFSFTVTVSAGAKYEYQACGKESAQNQYYCVGPDGTANTTEVFTAGALQARTRAPIDIRDYSATATGQIEWTNAGQATWWFQTGTTTAYGRINGYGTGALSANIAQSVSGELFGLSPGTSYHYRLCVADQPNADPAVAPAVCGADWMFKTIVVTTVSCGQTITASIHLANDLIDCPGDGLVIGAPNITLDLNGHRIGAEAGHEIECRPSYFGPTSGVRNSGFDRVTIENGNIGGESVFSAFYQGILLDNADDNILRNLFVHDSICAGIWASEGNRTQIDHNTVSYALTRVIFVDGGAGNVVQSNWVGEAGHVGIGLWTTSNNRVEGNSVSSGQFGIELVYGAQQNQVLGNTVEGQVFDGIVLAEGSDDNVVDRNTVSNMTTNDPDPGDPGQYGGIEVVATSSRNRITNNQLSGNKPPNIAIGLPLSCGPGCQPGASDANVVSGNTTSTSATDGIIIGRAATNTSVTQNVANRNGDDGVDVNVASTTITGNTARNNGDRGIEAVTGVTDGGGNRASGNGRRCLNVACTR